MCSSPDNAARAAPWDHWRSGIGAADRRASPEAEGGQDVGGAQGRPGVVEVANRARHTPNSTQTPPAQLAPGERMLEHVASGRFERGRVVEGTWSKSNVTEPIQYRGPDGAPVALTPGATWVLLPEPGEATLR